MDNLIGIIVLVLFVAGSAIAEGLKQRRKELERRAKATPEERDAAERRARPTEVRDVVMDSPRRAKDERAPDRPARRPEPRKSPLEGPLREIARQLGIPEEVLPLPPQQRMEEEQAKAAPPPKPRREQKPAPAAAAAVPPATPATPANAARMPRKARPAHPSLPASRPFVFHADPIVNAIIASEVLRTPRQRRRLRRTPRG